VSQVVTYALPCDQTTDPATLTAADVIGAAVPYDGAAFETPPGKGDLTPWRCSIAPLS